MSITLLSYTSLNSVPGTDQCSVTYLVERQAIYFHRFNMAGRDEMETYRHTNDDSETDSDDIDTVGA